MNEEAEKKYILSVRCIDTSAMPGAQKRKCMRCGELCWVSPSLQNEKVDGVICDHCMPDFEKEEIEDVDYVLKPEVEEEFLRWKANRDKTFAM